jgi:hypothetical protein
MWNYSLEAGQTPLPLPRTAPHPVLAIEDGAAQDSPRDQRKPVTISNPEPGPKAKILAGKINQK